MQFFKRNFNVKFSSKSKKKRHGLTLMITSLVLLFFMPLQVLPFINSLLLGAFGLSSYLLLAALAGIGLMMYLEKEVYLQKTEILLLVSWLILFFSILHLFTTQTLVSLSFSDYIKNIYAMKSSFGGVLISLLVFPIASFTHVVAAYVLFMLAMLFVSTAIIHRLHDNIKLRSGKIVPSKSEVEEHEVPQTLQPVAEEKQIIKNTEKTNKFSDKDFSTNDIFISDEEFEEMNNDLSEEDEQKSKAKAILGLSEEEVKAKEAGSKIKVSSYNNTANQPLSKKDYILQPKMPSESLQGRRPINSLTEINEQDTSRPRKFVHDIVVGGSGQANKSAKKKLSESDLKNLEFLRSTLGTKPKNFKFNEKNELVEDFGKQNHEENLNNKQPFEIDGYINNEIYDESVTKSNYKKHSATQTLFNNNVNESGALNAGARKFAPAFNENNDLVINERNNDFDDDSFIDDIDFNENNNVQDVPPVMNVSGLFANSRNTANQSSFNNNGENNKDVVKKGRIKKAPTKYVAPPTDLLLRYVSEDNLNSEDYEQKAIMLEETLASFRINAKVVSVTKGPAFTRFELQMPPGTAVKRVTSYVDDLAMVLEAQGAVRVEIPIPGKNAFGVEVPNESIEIVGLRDVIESYSFEGSKSLLTFALGKDITGESKVARLDKMPHLLVAGATNSGKSVALNSLLISLIYKASPDDLKLLLIDPKRVEFTLFNGLPHLIIPNVITDTDKAISAFNWVIDEMERRFKKFEKLRVRNLDEFNSTTEVSSGMEDKLPFIVVVVDELADLMSTNKKDIEEKIIRIAQKSRAAGIHLVLATQRPSVDVITGVIKANLPSRIAFAVSSFPDSKTILDQSGAEKLLGRGDMLYSPNDMPDPIRIQGAYVSTQEIADVIDFVKGNNEAYFDSEIEDSMFNKNKNSYDGVSEEEFDPLLKEATRTIIKTGGVSISKIQRMFAIGFPRAGKIVDQMEKLGFITPQDASKNRTVLISQQEFEEKFGEDL